MDFSKLQIIALVVLTTILTDKFLINHNSNNIQNPTESNSSTNIISEKIIPTISPTPTSYNYQNEIILKEIQNLRQEITTIRDPVPTTAVITTMAPSLINGMVKINSPKWQKIDVFEKASASSKIINSIYYDVIYFYTSKTKDWYQLNLDGGQVGWVQSSFLAEYP